MTNNQFSTQHAHSVESSQPIPAGVPGPSQPHANRHHPKRFGAGVVLAMLAAAVVTAGIGGAVGAAAEKSLASAHTQISSSAGPLGNPPVPVTSSIEQIADKALPSVVELQISTDDEDMQGSGIILSSDGLILTNNHVVAPFFNGQISTDQVKATVKLQDGRTAAFTLVGKDPATDIAVVRVEGLSGLTPMKIGSSANLRVGQRVVAVGAPLGLQNTVTTGIISALNRPMTVPGEAGEEDPVYEAIQTDAAINPGNSGGALVNDNGELIGVNSAGTSPSGGGSVGLNFAIPVDQAKRIADELIATGGRVSYASLGVRVADDSDGRGARIAAVTHGGAAEAAGLPARSVVTRIDNQPIDTADALVAAVRSKAPGAQVTLTYLDPAGVTKTAQIILGTEQTSDSGPNGSVEPAS
jgi:putative serine protease PepD